MALKSLIQNQTVDFDTHQAGDGKPVDITGLHMHKRMNDKKYKGVDIIIPLDPNKPIVYSGNNSKHQDAIMREIKKVFKDERKVFEMAEELASVINRYSTEMNIGERKDFLEKSAKAIVKHFGLKPEIYDTLYSKTNEHINLLITSHIDEYGKLFYLKQDIKRSRIKIGDDLEKLFYRNNPHK